MDEVDIARVLSADLSEGTEAFRDALLERCLSVIADGDDGMSLDDDQLELLAAAGLPGGDLSLLRVDGLEDPML